MEEHLKTIRSVHRTILALCATVLVFAVSPDRATHYDLALKELEELRTIKESPELFGQYVKNAFAKRIGTRLVDAVKKGVEYPLSPTCGRRVFRPAVR